jgi:UDP-N-acetyl-D-glucosamine dehydrogenase
VVDKAARVLNRAKKPLNGSNVLLLGMAYKADLDDHRGSPAIAIYQQLEDAGALVTFYDSWTPTVSEDGFNATSIELTEDALRNTDLVIITTDHSNIEYRRIVELAPLILDTRNATRGIESEKIVLM